MTEEEKPKNKIVFVTLKMPDGKEHEIPLPPKVFSSGREGFYAQIPALRRPGIRRSNPSMEKNTKRITSVIF